MQEASAAADVSGEARPSPRSSPIYPRSFIVMLARLRSVFSVLSIAAISAGMGWWFGQREVALLWSRYKPEIVVVKKAVPPKHQDVDFSLFWDVWDRLDRDYLDSSKIKPDQMVYGAIQGMTQSLGDPYTVFLPPQKQEEAKADLAGEFEGIGIQLGYKKERLAVIAPLDGSPAKAAGIQAGDYILRVRDEKKDIDVDTEGMTLPEAVDVIRGPSGSPVTLTMFRENGDADVPGKAQKPFDVTITRDKIKVKSVTVEFVRKSTTGNTGTTSTTGEESQGNNLITCGTRDTSDTCNTSVAYVRLSRFGDQTNAEWTQTVEQIIKKSNQRGATLTGVILDLRNNPGGYLESAVTVGSEFFMDGKIVEQKGKSTSHSYDVTKPGRLTELPLVVLVNEGSASASEIVAGAIQARERGKLVGTHTFGKGTVQDAQDLRGGAGIHITTSRWLLPNGNWIHDEGLKPDIELEYDEAASRDQKWDNQVKKAIEILLIEEN